MNKDSKKRKCIIVSICLVIVLAIISCVFIKKNISNDNNYKTTEKNKDTATKTEVVDRTTEVTTTEKSKSNNKKGGSISGGVKKDHNTKEGTSEEKSDDNDTKTPGTTEYTGSTEEPTTQRQADNDDGGTKKPPKKDDSGKKEPETSTQKPVTPEKPDKPAEHVHTWRDVTKHHDAVTHTDTKRVLVKEAWDEDVTISETHLFCNNCDLDLTIAYGGAGSSMDNHLLTCGGGTGCYSYPVSVTTKKHHDPVYENQTITVTDKEAWTEHWKECTSCGAIEK